MQTTKQSPIKLIAFLLQYYFNNSSSSLLLKVSTHLCRMINFVEILFA